MNQDASLCLTFLSSASNARSFFLAVIAMAFASGLSAQQITPAMIEQFQNLPSSQQEALAQQYGVDLDDILASQSQLGQSTIGQPGQPLQPIYNDNQASARAGLIEEMLLDAQVQNTRDEDQMPKRYGMDLFNAEISTFAPVDDALVPDEYKLGPGDTLVIQLFGAENEQYSLSVSRTGEINFPRFGPISLAGLSFEDAEALIQRRVEEQLIGVQAVVSMGRLRAISVFMAGEVARPGSYAVSALTSVTQALFVAGGVSEIGSLRKIEVKRSGETVGSFDIYDLLIRGDASGDIRLQSGDVVFVPPYSGIVKVEGAARRPMLYEVSESENIDDLIKMAGGFSNNAHRGSAVLERVSSGINLPELRNLDLNSSSDLAVLLRDGDLLRIPVAADYFDNQITLEGAVVRPGNYAWHEGIRVSDIVRSIDADLLQEVDLDYALIVRLKNARRDIDVHQFDLSEAILNKGSENDLLLNRQDKILVFGLVDEEILAEEQALEEELLSLEREAQLIAMGVVLPDTEEYSLDEEEKEEQPSFRRQDLLQPVLAKLRTQARQGEPVQIVSVSGAVKVPGEYPLKDGDRIFDLVRAAGGLNDSAYLGGAEFRRVSEIAGEVKSEFTERSLASYGQSGSVENIALQSRDHLTVREIPDWSPDRQVTLSGEVRFPGTYLYGKGETLGDVLARAGGLTEDGFAAGALFTREAIREREAEQAKQYAEQIIASYAAATLTREELQSSYAEIQQITARLAEYEGVGRMVIDLESILAGDPSADIALLNEDELFIPQRSDSIVVIGEVLRAATHSYQSSFDVSDYLELSAGLSKRADDDSIYIVKANGAVIRSSSGSGGWLSFSSRDSRLQPGDTIVVPIDNEYKDRWSFWTDVTQIFYQGGLAIAAVLAI